MTTEWFSKWFASRSDLNNNRWEPAADELAIYFNTNALKGIATKTLRIPGGCEARVLADNQVRQLNEGEETLENLWERINSLFAGKHAEILITRRAALAVPFTLRDLNCGDLNRINAQLVLRMQVGDVEAFHNHFMRQPGSVNTAQLQALLDAAVRHAVSEFTHKRIRDEVLADAGQTRSDLNSYLDGSLKRLMAEFGLALQALESVEWDYVPTADDLEKEANEVRRKATWQRYQQGCTKLEEAESAATLREREIELLDRVTGADTREQAIRLGAADALESLEAQYRGKQRARERETLGEKFRIDDEKAEWEHLRSLAAIRRSGLEQISRERQSAEADLTREQSRNELARLKIQQEIEQNQLLEDEAERKARQAASAEAWLRTQLRDESLAHTRHRIELDTLEFEAKIRQGEQLRVQQWEDAQLEAKIAKLQGETAEATADAKLSGLRALIKLDDEDERNEIARLDLSRMNEIKADLFRQREQLQLKIQDEEALLERELRRSSEARKQAMEAREDELRKANVFGSLPPEALAAMVNDPQQLKAIKEIFMIRSGLGAEQIRALNSEATAAPQFAAAGLSSSQVENAVGGAVSREVQQLLERWRADDARQWDRFDRMHSEAMDKMEKMGDKIKDTAIEMAKALAPAGGAAQTASPQLSSYTPPAQNFSQPTPHHGGVHQTIQQTCAPASPLGMRVCNCGVINAQIAKFCSACGNQLGN